MPIVNRIGDMAPEMKDWRQALHRMPELMFDCHKTAAFVAEKLRAFGVDEIHEGIAETGIVALIHGQGAGDGDADGPVIGLRADMDALPITEATGLDYKSEINGMMHACGHDGHTTMLLGAAKYLAETRNFKGTVALIFQPAEEEGGGGDAMVREGILDRFDIAEVYALHNAPGTPVGEFYTTPGPIMAAVDTFEVFIKGRGGHGAYPQDCIDPIPAAVAMVQGIQTIVSRNHDGRKDLVVSVTQVHAGTVNNVIPEEAYLNGTIRTFDRDVQALVFARLKEIVAGHAAAFGVEADIRIEVGYPATVNEPGRTAFAVEVAQEIAGSGAVRDDVPPEMGAEDFSYLLNERPGAYLFVGNGDSAGLHHPEYDFNDDTAAIGASFFARLVERALPL